VIHNRSDRITDQHTRAQVHFITVIVPMLTPRNVSLLAFRFAQRFPVEP